ncbi:MAG: hypothetical protein ACXVYY_01345 [Oryzihumus sp.]
MRTHRVTIGDGSAAVPPPVTVVPGDVKTTRPYAAATLWNTPLSALYPSGVPISPASSTYMARVLDNKGVTPQRNYLGSDATQSTLPIYYVDNTTPLKAVRVWGSWRYGNDNSVAGTYQVNQDVGVPMPASLCKPVGFSDYYVVILNTDTGDEWCFWKVGTTADESSQPGLDSSGTWVSYDVGSGVQRWTCQSASRYQAAPADGISGGIGGFINGTGLPSFVNNPKQWNQRGSKIPEQIGLVRPWEIAQGHIDHAIAWAYHGPSPDHVLPAQSSDGGNFGGVSGVDLPEGARIRLDPSFNLNLFPPGAARIIGKAMQDYGCLLIDNAGYPKMYVEAITTAPWGSDVTPSMLSAAPLSAYQVVDWTAPYR